MSELLYSREDMLEDKERLGLQVQTVSEDRAVPTLSFNSDGSNNCQAEKTAESHIFAESVTDQERKTGLKQKRLHDEDDCDKRSEESDARTVAHKRLKTSCQNSNQEGKTLPFILDIDLDFFSTANPFKEVYSERLYYLLRQLYHCALPSGASEKVRFNSILKDDRN